MREFLKNKPFVISLFSITIFLLCIFFLIIQTNRTDINLHAGMAQKMKGCMVCYPSNFLYYMFVIQLGNILFFFKEYKGILVASGIILSLATIAKYILSYSYLSKSLKTKYTDLQICLFSFVLILLGVLPITYFFCGNFYFGLTPANIWHNSTLIILVPLAIALYLLCCNFLEKPDKKTLWFIILFIFLNTLAKPSFLFCLLPVFPLFLMYKFKFSKWMWIGMSTLLWAVCLILLSYFWLYIFQNIRAGKGITIEFFTVWASYFQSNYGILLIFVSIFVSAMFPILFLSFYWKRLKGDTNYWFAFALFVTAIFIAIAVKEEGLKWWHGNFM